MKSIKVMATAAVGSSLLCHAQFGCAAQAQGDEPITEIVVIAPYGAAIERRRVPSTVQVATAEDIARTQPLDLTELLNRTFSGVNINHAQNNPLQPDVNFRGFTASPLLGLPQGLAVYQDGVRINEPFGDTVNWDLIPLSAIDNVQMIGGANPVFGLNSLGGALSLRTKNGFTFQGTEAQIFSGSFGRTVASLQHGGHNGGIGYYGNIDYFEEDGWRDFSHSEALRFFGALTLQDENSKLNVSLALGETDLRGNGASPVELLAIDRAQVFTHPDRTENSQVQAILDGTHRFSSAWQIAGNVYYRQIDTDSFNGDGTIFEECEFGDDEFLVEEDFDDLNDDDECSFDDDADITLVRNASGEPIEAEIDGFEQDAINNIGRREQDSYGASAQLTWKSLWGGRENDLTFGAALNEGRTSFDSATEVARLLETRATSRTGIFADEYRTDVRSEVSIASAYFANTLDLNDRAALTVSGRFDTTRIRLADRTGASPELNGNHRFQRFNPAVGLSYSVSPDMTMFVNVGESTRTPTPVELACASEDAPCNLPNAFLADPPLEQVVARSAEFGLRGMSKAGLRWSVAAFHTTNRDDILFQTTGGAQANVGFFDNVGDTQRRGVDVGIAQQLSRFRWSFEYSLVEATFEDALTTNSPNHPVFEENENAPQIVGDDKLLVAAGSYIPGIPRHQANLGGDFSFNDRFSIGADVIFRSGVYLRGDEANLLDKTSSYALLNLRSEYRFNEHAALFARIENALDENYETFGLLGEPDEVFAEFDDVRFFGAGPPFGAWIGLRVNF